MENIDWSAIARANTASTEARTNLMNAQANALGMPKTVSPLIPGAETSNSIAMREARQSAAGTPPPATTSSLPELGTSFIEKTTNFLGQSGDILDKPIRAKMGLTKVPGKGNGTKDTVKAKLAPGEAVLNKAAADKVGRGLIGALNTMGAKKMGLV